MDITHNITETPTAAELFAATTKFATRNGRTIAHDEGYAILCKLLNGQQVVYAVSQSEGTLFSIGAQHKGPSVIYRITPTLCGKHLLGLIYDRLTMLIDDHPEHTFRPEILTLKDVLAKLGLEYLVREELTGKAPAALQVLCTTLNSCVDHIRAELTTPAFQARIRKTSNASRKNQCGAFRWLDFILQKHSRLCAIRIDLTYQKIFQWKQAGSSELALHAVTLEESFEHRERFLRQLPNWIDKDALLGYALKTEFTVRRSIHHHVLILLNGNKLCSAEVICHMLGYRWIHQITQGRGDYHNVNEKTDKNSATCGIGDVFAHDLAKVENLKRYVITYLAKHDHSIRWVIPRKHRLFLKSVAKALMGKKPGRKRTKKPTVILSDSDAASSVVSLATSTSGITTDMEVCHG
jgi:hypothetical protein